MRSRLSQTLRQIERAQGGGAIMPAYRGRSRPIALYRPAGRGSAIAGGHQAALCNIIGGWRSKNSGIDRSSEITSSGR
jgi:hypothetical protein